MPNLSLLESKLSAVLAFSVDLNQHIVASIPADNTLSEQDMEKSIGDLFIAAESAPEAEPGNSENGSSGYGNS